MKLLNKISVLDHGYVGLHTNSLSQSELQEIAREYNYNKIDESILSIPYIHMNIYCPLFFQLTISQSNLKILVKKNNRDVKAWVPDQTQIGSGDLETDRLISNDIKQTTEALLINPKAYQKDRCDHFVSQVITPISTYNNLVVSGTLLDWIKFIHAEYPPMPVEEYFKAIEAALLADWIYFDKWIRRENTN